jgi:hypothetical protein
MTFLKTDKDRGFNGDHLAEALESAEDMRSDENFDNFVGVEKFKQAKANSDEGYWPRLPGSADVDPRGHILKPTNTKHWDRVPATPAEQAVYHGLHIHTTDNPLGLHSHVIGGTMGGGHSHGPQNRFGVHHHRDEDGSIAAPQLDGRHTHEAGDNMPSGSHEHRPENFG